MSINKISFQFPEETIVKDIHNHIMPVKGDIVSKSGKKYIVVYRIFNHEKDAISLVLEEL